MAGKRPAGFAWLRFLGSIHPEEFAEMDSLDGDLSPEVRARLREKGRLLYGKFCGTEGRGPCAESFAKFHIGRGEPEVARDLLAFLEETEIALRLDDPQGRLELTRELGDRIRRTLEAGPRGP